MLQYWALVLHHHTFIYLFYDSLKSFREACKFLSSLQEKVSGHLGEHAKLFFGGFFLFVLISVRTKLFPGSEEASP